MAPGKASPPMRNGDGSSLFLPSTASLQMMSDLSGSLPPYIDIYPYHCLMVYN